MLFSLALVASINSGCKNPICRVGGNIDISEMKKWMNVDNPKTTRGQSWQSLEDFRHKRIFIREPDFSLLCEPDCAKAKVKIKHAFDLYLVQVLRTDAQHEIVDSESTADFEICIKISTVKERHYIEYLNSLGDRNYYKFWIKVVNLKTSNTAFWSYGTDYFNENDHAFTYRRIITQMSHIDHKLD
jgi:hypothetical protein